MKNNPSTMPQQPDFDGADNCSMAGVVTRGSRSVAGGRGGDAEGGGA